MDYKYIRHTFYPKESLAQELFDARKDMEEFMKKNDVTVSWSSIENTIRSQRAYGIKGELAFVLRCKINKSY